MTISKYIGLIFLLLLSCASHAQAGRVQPAPEPKLATVAVWDFENQTVPALTPLTQLDFLKRSLSEAILSALFNVPGLKVVERQQLRDILTEQKLGSGELADADTRLRLGRMIGAQRMVFGSFMAVGDQVRVDLRAVNSETSQVVFADEYTTSYDLVLDEAQKMAARISQALGGRPAPSVRVQENAIWIEYDRALELVDKGDYVRALDMLKSILEKDKDFSIAERQLTLVLEKLSRQ